MTTERFKTEMVEVAAVAVAAAETILYLELCETIGPDTFARVEDLVGGPLLTDEILELVKAERARQDEKWGSQRNHSPLEWLGILSEEVGETAGEIKRPPASEPLSHVWEALRNLEQLARHALESHEWEPRQQEVFDVEVAAGDDPTDRAIREVLSPPNE